MEGEARWRRRDCWRTKERFPKVDAELEWLDEMLRRVVYNIPPTSETEYRKLPQTRGVVPSERSKAVCPGESPGVWIESAAGG